MYIFFKGQLVAVALAVHTGVCITLFCRVLPKCATSVQQQLCVIMHMTQVACGHRLVLIRWTVDQN